MLIGSGGRCDGETGVSRGHLPDMYHDWSINGGQTATGTSETTVS